MDLDRFITFVFAAYLLTTLPASSMSRLGNSSKTLLMGITVLLTWSIIQQIFFQLQSEEHSVLGQIVKLGSSNFFLTPTLTLMFTLALTYLLFVVLHAKHKSTQWLSNIIIHSGFIVSLIALSHWFYDNGKLFWFLEPDNVFTSNRARWPFVNSNHLGHFLLIPIFVSIASLRKLLTSSNNNQEGPNNTSRLKKISKLGTSRGQTKLIKVLYVFLALLSMVLALFGSISRGAIFGFAVGLLVLSISSILTREKGADLIQTPGASKQSDDDRRRRRRGPDPAAIFEKYLSKTIQALPYLIAIGGIFLFSFFLSGEGAERIEGRLEYSMLHSKDNIRFEMYKDSFNILKDYPLGVGLGNWEHVYPSYADNRLAGLNPVYLHSDIFQLVVELGFPAFLLILGFAAYFIGIIGKRCLFRAGHILEKSCFSGALALIIASFLDFPFRIPSILLIFCLSLTLLAYLDDKYTEGEPDGM